MEKLSDDGPMGIYADPDGYFRSEYQIGKRLIWVKCRHGRACRPCVGKVDEILPDLWAAMPDVVAIAEDYSRTKIPDFWSKHDGSKREGNRLDVWGFTITADLGEAKFVVSRNHAFDYNSPTFSKDDYWNDDPILLPDLPDRHYVYVVRDRSGQLDVVAMDT